MANIDRVASLSRVEVESPTQTVDLIDYLMPGGIKFSKAQLGTPLGWNGQLNFQRPIANDPDIELDPRVSNLWCRGTKLRLYLDFGTGDGDELVCELILFRASISRLDWEGKVDSIACQYVNVLTEQNERGKDKVLVEARGFANPRLVASRAIEEGTNRSLDVDFNHIAVTRTWEAYTLLANQSAASLAAEAAAANATFIYCTHDSKIRDIRYPLQNDPDKPPVVDRWVYVELVDSEPLAPSEDIATKVIATGTYKKLVNDDVGTYRDTVRQVNEVTSVYGNETIGSGAIMTLRSSTTYNPDGSKLEEIERPLATFPQGVKKEELTVAERFALKRIHRLTKETGEAQYNAAGLLVTDVTTNKGPSIAFRRNFSDTIEGILDDSARILGSVTLKSVRNLQYQSGLPLIQSGYEERLVDDYSQTPVNAADATNNKLRVNWTVQYKRWRDGQYIRKRTNDAPGVQFEVTTEITGPPQVERDPRGTPFDPPGELRDELIKYEYEPDTSGVNCGNNKTITIENSFADGIDSLKRLAQYEAERRMANYYAFAFQIDIPDWIIGFVPFRRVQVHDREYVVDALAISWNKKYELEVAFEGLDIGQISPAVAPPPTSKPAWPRSATRVFEPILAPASACPVAPAPITPPSTAQIAPLGDFEFAIGVPIHPIVLDGTPAGTYAAQSLPPGLIVQGKRIIGTPSLLGTFTVTASLNAGAAGIDTAIFDITIVPVPIPAFPIPVVFNLDCGAAAGSSLSFEIYSAGEDPETLDEFGAGATSSLEIGSPVIASFDSGVGAGTELVIIGDSGFNPYQVDTYIETGHLDGLN